MDYNPTDVAQKIVDKIKKEYEELEKLNVMVLGKTGVGKSTLINNMFMKKIVKTGVGRPVTNTIRKVEEKGFPLAIYDTPGLELSGENSIENLLDEIKKIIEEGLDKGNISDAIHCIWYCISTASHRIEDAEVEFIKEFINKTNKYNIPVIIVLTQSYSKKDAKELTKYIKKLKLNVENIIPILAEDMEIDDDYTVEAYGLDTLAEVMNEIIPEAVKKTFVSIQSKNLQLKKDKAQAIVATAALTAAGIGASPIPFSDAVVLIPTQIGMLASITVTFGLPIEKATIVGVLSSTIGTGGATILGKSVVAGLFKLIPGLGSIAGGVITATTASVITSALGNAYIKVLEMIYKGELKIDDLSTKVGKDLLVKIFKEFLKINKDHADYEKDNEYDGEYE